MHRLRYAFSDAIDCPQIHLPVFWIPAFPAGMTAFRHSGRDCRNLEAMEGNAPVALCLVRCHRLPGVSPPCVLDTGIPCRYDVLAGSFQCQRPVIPAGIAGI